MNLNQKSRLRDPEKAAVKALLEFSHKENFSENNNTECSIDPWVLKKPFNPVTNPSLILLPQQLNQNKTTHTTPGSFSSKPQLSAQILNKIPPIPTKSTLKSAQKILAIHKISILPPKSSTPLHFIKRPISIRSSSYRPESEDPHKSSKDSKKSIRKKYLLSFLTNIS